MGLGYLLHGGAMLAQLVVHVFHGAIVIGLGDDLVVDAGDDLFDHVAAVRAGRLSGARLGQGGNSKQHGAEEGNNGDGKGSKAHKVSTQQATVGLRLGYRRYCKWQGSPGAGNREQGVGNRE